MVWCLGTAPGRRTVPGNADVMGRRTEKSVSMGLPRLKKLVPSTGTVSMARSWESQVVYERPSNHKAEGV